MRCILPKEILKLAWFWPPSCWKMSDQSTRYFSQFKTSCVGPKASNCCDCRNEIGDWQWCEVPAEGRLRCTTLWCAMASCYLFYRYTKAQKDVAATQGSLMDIRTSDFKVPLQLAILFCLCLLALSIYHWRYLPLSIFLWTKWLDFWKGIWGNAVAGRM